MSLEEKAEFSSTTKEGDLKYIILAVELKSDTRIRHEGLYVGIRPIVNRPTAIASPDDDYFHMYYEGAIQVFHTDYYRAVYMEVCIDAFTASKPYTEADQEDVISRLEKAYEVAKEWGWLKNGLIDPDKYTEIPAMKKHMLSRSSGVGIGSAASSKAKTGSAGYTGVGRRASVHNRQTTTTTTKKEVHTSEIARTSKYPVDTALESMKSKLEKIQEGTYKQPVLKKIPADIEAEKKREAAAKEEEKKNPMGHPHLCICPMCSEDHQKEVDEHPHMGYFC
jgi:hypothetical protein